MPENVNEELWKEAKQEFINSYNREPSSNKDWALVMDIYKNIGGTLKKKSNTYTYSMEFEPKEVIKKGEKKYIIEGYVSTIDEDLSNETVTMSAQRDIYNQITNRIPKATVTGDEEHEIYDTDDGNYEDSIPKVKFIDAQLTDKGVWVKAEINKDHPDIKNVWDSIKNKFLNAFSITFIPLEAVKKRVGDRWKSFINRLNLLNITLTGNPMNPGATFNPVMKSAADGYMDSFDTQETNSKNKGDSMTELDKKEAKEVKQKADDLETKSEEEAKEDPKPEEEEKKEENPKAKEYPKEESEEVEKKSEDSGLLKKELEDIKAELKALKEKPIFKAKVEEPKLNKKSAEEKKDFNAFNYIK